MFLNFYKQFFARFTTKPNIFLWHQKGILNGESIIRNNSRKYYSQPFCRHHVAQTEIFLAEFALIYRPHSDQMIVLMRNQVFETIWRFISIDTKV